MILWILINLILVKVHVIWELQIIWKLLQAGYVVEITLLDGYFYFYLFNVF